MSQYMLEIIDEEDRQRLHENLLVGPAKLPIEVIRKLTILLMLIVHIVTVEDNKM